MLDLKIMYYSLPIWTLEGKIHEDYFSFISQSEDYLGFTFRPRVVRDRRDKVLFTSFLPAISKKYERFWRKGLVAAHYWLGYLAEKEPNLFYHW